MAARKTKRKTAKKASARRKTTARRKTAKKATARKTRSVAAKRKTTTRRKKSTARRKTTAKRSTARKSTRKRTVRKTAARKSTRKSAARRKSAAKAAASGINLKKVPAVRSAYSKSAIVGAISEQVGITRKEASAALEVLGNVIHAHVSKGGCGEFKLPGLLKVVVVHKPARKARKGINPFTGEEMVFKAKPAHKVVRVRPLKQLKEMVK